MVFERPIILRGLFSFSSLLLALLFVVFVRAHTYDAALYEKVTGIETSRADNILVISFLAVSVGLPCVLFLWMAGPYKVLFDIDQCLYFVTQGFPLMTRTKCGVTSGGTFYVIKTKPGRYQRRFRPFGYKYGYPLDTYQTDEQARMQAHILADKLGLIVERRDANELRIGTL